MNLVEALAAFNRKERYWLLQNALGRGALTLDDGFRARLHDCVKLDIPEDAWWAMDYHLDWLVGALRMVDGGTVEDPAQPNEKDLVKGNQEDMDLIVAFGDTLILIEAKGDTSWGNTQIHSKLNRLDAMLQRQERLMGFVPRLRLVLISPKESKGLDVPEGGWPEWMLNADRKPFWMDMEMGPDRPRLPNGRPDFRKVSRWNAERNRPDKDGSHWKVL